MPLGNEGTLPMAAGGSLDDMTRSFVTLTPGTVVSHYNILESIGSGGMGEVYRARDTILDRPVAIKFLSAHKAASDDHRRRFLREARAAARLRHQNIVIILDLGEFENVPFIVFEYLDPRTLRHRMKESPLNLDEVYRISIGLVNGISEAHRKGVIHRDIKPSNVLMDDAGDPKLVDFGLAVIVTLEDETRTAGIAGTIGYMSPEQARGGPVDERSDYFSLGMVIYEMITGVNPFRRDTAPASIDALFHDDPPPLRKYRADIPGRLDDIVQALLQKDPAGRYQCAEHIRDDLIACRDAKLILGPLRQDTCAGENRLAVLPFDVLRTDHAQERLGEMIAHLLITGLSDASGVNVVSGQRLFDLLSLEGLHEVHEVERSLATRLARRAEARWMLLGMVMNQSPLVITTQLVDVNNGLLITGHRFNLAKEANVFDAADRILETLKVDLGNLTSKPISRLIPVSELTTNSPQALECFLKGFEWQARWNEEKAKAEYEKAIEYDPKFAMAYYGLASIPVPNRIALIERAVELAENATFRERCYIRALHRRIKGDRSGSLAILLELLQRHGDEKLACFWVGVNLHYLNDFGEAVAYLRRAIELDPLYTPAYNQLVYTLNRDGQFEESMIIANQYIQLTPDDANPYDTRAEVLGFNGRLEAALASYREAMARQPVLVPSIQRSGILYVLKQDYDHARELFDRLPQYVPANPWVDPHMYQVTILLRQGKWRLAMEYLDQGIAEDARDPQRALHVAYKREIKAITYLELNFNDLAREELEMARTILDAGPWWYFFGIDLTILQSRIMARDGRIKEAGDLIETEFGDIGEHDLVRRMRYRLGQGLVRIEVGDDEGALKFLEDADSIRPRWLSAEHFLLQSALAKTYLALGHLDRTVELLETGMHVYAESRAWQMLLDVKNHFFLGQAYERSGWHKKAGKQYSIFLDIWKDADQDIPEIDDARSRLARLENRE